MMSIPLPDEFKSRKEWETRVWRIITEELAGASSAKEIERILSALLTAHEKKQMVKRAAAAFLLKQGKSYREVGKELWLSPIVISAIRKSLFANVYISHYGRKKKKQK